MSAAFLGSDTYKLPSANKRLSLACSASSCSIKPGKLSYSRCSLKLSFLGAIVFEGVADALAVDVADGDTVGEGVSEPEPDGVRESLPEGEEVGVRELAGEEESLREARGLHESETEPQSDAEGELREDELGDTVWEREGSALIDTIEVLDAAALAEWLAQGARSA